MSEVVAGDGDRAAGDGTAVGSAVWWRQWHERQARRRPRADGLTVERILAVSLAIVDAEGLDALTVRRIADELGTGSATLYRHVTSREELLELLVDHVIGDVRQPPAELGWRAKVERLATELRRVLIEHAGLVPALATSPLLGPNAMRGADRGLASLLEGGFPPKVAVLAYRSLLDYVLGTVFFDTSRVGRRRRHVRDALADDPFLVAPALRAHDEAIGATTNEDVFRFGLRALLDGIERQHRAGGRPAGGPSAHGGRTHGRPADS
ncbi:MAG TPA: TetR/AcrR family transcriptional regulator [Acidimicrobiales bacterium]